MPSLKEVKTRIGSVKNTRKITNAMKMVASSKLHHAQKDINGLRPYGERLASIMARFLKVCEGEVETPYAEAREVKKVTLVVISSNSSLCGAFNANVIKEFQKTSAQYIRNGVKVEVWPIGKKIAKAVQKAGFVYDADMSGVLEHPGFDNAVKIAEKLMTRFVDGETDMVEIISQHFASTSKQEIRKQKYLPINLDASSSEPESSQGCRQTDYIVEPSIPGIISSLIPASLHMQMFSSILDSIAAEHAARVVAMQIATDNADNLIEELTLTYNKTRQQAITSELLDMASGSFQ